MAIDRRRTQKMRKNILQIHGKKAGAKNLEDEKILCSLSRYTFCAQNEGLII